MEGIVTEGGSVDLELFNSICQNAEKGNSEALEILYHFQELLFRKLVLDLVSKLFHIKVYLHT